MPDSEVLVSVKDNSKFLFHHMLREGRNTVGRGGDRDLVIPADNLSQVSREHLSIDVDNDSDSRLTVVFDRIDERFQPANLTYINGYSVDVGKKVPLRLTDTISLGAKGYKLHVGRENLTMPGPYEEIAIQADEVMVNGRQTKLALSQKSFIKLLMASQGEILSYGHIYSQITKKPANNRVNSKYYCQRLVSQIRKLIDERYPGFLIKTIEEEGYQFRKPELEWTSLT